MSKGVMAMLVVDDLARALAFYRDGLGGTERYRFPPEGEADFMTLAFGDTEIGLGRVAERPMHGQPQRPASGHRIELCIYVDDVDQAVAALESGGFPILLQPQDQPWGERVAFASDADGNAVMLAMPL